MYSYSQLCQDKITIENEIFHYQKLLDRAHRGIANNPQSNQKLIEYLEDEINILQVDLRYINEDLEKASQHD